MSRPPARPRRQRRQDERDSRKAVRERQRLTMMLPGGDAENPIDVPSASVVEIQARAMPCMQCQGELQIRQVRMDRASVTTRGVLRALEMVCRRCHAPRDLWFRIAPPLPS